MEYWHMQLHPHNKDGYTKADILKIVKTGYIGIDIDSTYAAILGVDNKPFNEWDEETLNKYNDEYSKWKSQIRSFINLKNNNIVLVRHGEDFIALVKIIDDYIFENPSVHWFRHKYKVEILSTYLDFKKEYKIAKAQQTFEVSRSGSTYKAIDEIYNITIKGKEMQEKINLLKSRNQIILQGPPGTGKTRMAKIIARNIIKKSIVEKEPKINDLSEQVKLIQFHPSYSYEDFVRGIVAKTISTSTSSYIEYKTENKVLVDMANKAYAALVHDGFYKTNDKKEKEAILEKSDKYILIIDEINRANLSSVLGELIYALEYRDEAVESMYALEDGSRDITLPSNLYIIGTMNTADRSIGHIDYAIRRRFAFENVLPDEIYVSKDSRFADVKKIFEDTKMLSPEFEKDRVMLGHSYFIGDDNELKEKLKYQVVPLLREYVSDGVLTSEATAKIDDLLK